MQAHERIRAYREAHDIPPAILAKKLRIAESTLRSIENGTRRVSLNLAPAIERETGIPRTEFFPELFSA